MQLVSSDYDNTVGEVEVAPYDEVVFTRCQRIRSQDLPPPSGMTPVMSERPLQQTLAASTSGTTTTLTTTTTMSTTSTTTTMSSHQGDDHHLAAAAGGPTTAGPTDPSSTICPEYLHPTRPHKCSCADHPDDDNSVSTTSSDLCTCRPRPSTTQNPRKRKLSDNEDDTEAEVSELVQTTTAASQSRSRSEEMEKYKRLLVYKRRLLSNLAQKKCNNDVPLFYLYGDLLLIPKYYWGSGVGIGDSARRRSLNDPNLTTPIDSNHSLLQASSHPRSKTPSLVQVCPDTQSLEEGGFSPEWFGDVIKPVMHDLNRYGVCVVDNFLGVERANQIMNEVGDLHCRGLFCDGQVVAKNVQDQARGRIRGDKITWVTGSEPHCGKIGQLVSVVDTLIAKANKHQDGGELNRYNITWRTRAMVACYPGKGTHYVKHVDNPDGDGRCITAIYYLNREWTPDDGGVLRIYPEGSNQVAEIQPHFDRMLFFWSDRRNPHEVLPANETSRYAITVWYLDQTEREEYLARAARNPSHT